MTLNTFSRRVLRHHAAEAKAARAERDRRIVQLYQSGLSTVAIGRKRGIGLTAGAVNYVLRKEGIPIRNRREAGKLIWQKSTGSRTRTVKTKKKTTASRMTSISPAAPNRASVDERFVVLADAVRALGVELGFTLTPRGALVVQRAG